MVVKRNINYGKYFMAFVFSFLIFVIGIMLGSYLSTERVDYLRDIANKQKLDYESLELQSLYLSTAELRNESCIVLSRILEQSLKTVADAQIKVESYIRQISDSRYNDIKREYSIAQIRYWLLDKKIKDICEMDSVSILYFYSDANCDDCGAQGAILTYLKEKLKDRLLIFALDYDFASEPLIELFKIEHNIDSIPSLVIANKSYTGLMTKEKLLEEICPVYESKPELCSDIQ